MIIKHASYRENFDKALNPPERPTVFMEVEVSGHEEYRRLMEHLGNLSLASVGGIEKWGIPVQPVPNEVQPPLPGIPASMIPLVPETTVPATVKVVIEPAVSAAVVPSPSPKLAPDYGDKDFDPEDATVVAFEQDCDTIVSLDDALAVWFKHAKAVRKLTDPLQNRCSVRMSQRVAELLKVDLLAAKELLKQKILAATKAKSDESKTVEAPKVEATPPKTPERQPLKGPPPPDEATAKELKVLELARSLVAERGSGQPSLGEWNAAEEKARAMIASGESRLVPDPIEADEGAATDDAQVEELLARLGKEAKPSAGLAVKHACEMLAQDGKVHSEAVESFLLRCVGKHEVLKDRQSVEAITRTTKLRLFATAARTKLLD